ncbi:MAG TPA: baseplate J/gp47 family protein [Nitrososphaeraceae archaeon]|nr:baseplate J/gp47 family protein [Nitrososphaeraceae archaeon]
MYNKKRYIEIVDDILQHITRGQTSEKHLFSNSTRIYKLESLPENKLVVGEIEVRGFLNANPHTFSYDKDYKIREKTSIEWNISENNSRDISRPDENSIFEVSYVFNNSSGLTDVNTGSVIRTIVEGISKEIESLYDEMESVYKDGFIETSSGSSLDNVVSLLGIKRKSPTRAYGYVTFFKNSEPDTVTNTEILLFDGIESYELKNKPIKKIKSIVGIYQNNNYEFQLNKDYSLNLNDNTIVWLSDGKRPDEQRELTIEYETYQKVIIPSGTIVSTSSTNPKNIVSFETKQDVYMERKQEGKWEATIDIIAIDPGTSGNVIAGSINVMPKPPIGVDRVINRSNTEGGSDFEYDADLRERAKKILDEKGKATVLSLQTAIESIEGVNSTKIIDMPDEISGIVKVIVDGGDAKEIEKTIEETKAAGIRVEFDRPMIVLLDMRVILLVKKNIFNKEQIIASAEKYIRNYLSSLKIGNSLIINQLISLLLSIEQVGDVKDLVIDAFREKQDKTINLTAESSKMTYNRDNIVINYNERLYLRNIKIDILEDNIDVNTRPIR